MKSVLRTAKQTAEVKFSLQKLPMRRRSKICHQRVLSKTARQTAAKRTNKQMNKLSYERTFLSFGGFGKSVVIYCVLDAQNSSRASHHFGTDLTEGPEYCGKIHFWALNVLRKNTLYCGKNAQFGTEHTVNT